jgi:hypothetical protein
VRSMAPRRDSPAFTLADAPRYAPSVGTGGGARSAAAGDGARNEDAATVMATSTAAIRLAPPDLCSRMRRQR